MLNIYKLTIENFDKCYIGSTKQKISLRCARHRCDYKNSEKLNKKCSSFILFEKETDNIKVKYELIETTNDLSREGEIIRLTDNCINKNINVGLEKKTQKNIAYKKWKEEKREDYLNSKKRHADKKKHKKICPECNKELTCYYGENDNNFKRHLKIHKK